MKSLTALIRGHSLVIGILLMFLLTWPQDFANAGLLPFRVPFLLYLFMGWGIFVAAVLMTWLTLGRGAVAELLKRFLKGRVRWTWYLALLIIPAIDVLGVFLFSAITGRPADFSHVIADQLRPPGISRMAFVIPFLLTDAISNGEEIGWRGYGLPRLQARYPALTAATITGVLWAVWHLPRLLTHWDWTYFTLFVIDTVLKSIFLAWMYNGTGGSLLLTVLAHAAWNTAGVFLPTASSLSSANLGANAVQVALEVILVAVIVAVTGATNLSRTHARQVQA